MARLKLEEVTFYGRYLRMAQVLTGTAAFFLYFVGIMGGLGTDGNQPHNFDAGKWGFAEFISGLSIILAVGFGGMADAFTRFPWGQWVEAGCVVLWIPVCCIFAVMIYAKQGSSRIDQTALYLDFLNLILWACSTVGARYAVVITTEEERSSAEEARTNNEVNNRIQTHQLIANTVEQRLAAERANIQASNSDSDPDVEMGQQPPPVYPGYSGYIAQ